jgi:nicotinamide-nucleotide adenylyltransferase
MSKPFKLALLTGRYQNLQNGHVSNIKLAAQLAKRVIIVIGSAQEHGTERNPFTVDFRYQALQDIIIAEKLNNVEIMVLTDMTNENDICVEWGEYLLDRVFNFLTQEPDLIIHGDDGRDHDPIHWFSEEDKKGIHFLMVPRSPEDVSGTQTRKLAIINDYHAWSEQVPVTLHKHYHYMRGHLLTIPFYQAMESQIRSESV